MNATQLETRLTAIAAETFENSAIFVYLRDGVLWLAMRLEDGYRTSYRTMRAVGIPKMGLRRCEAEIRRIAEEY